MSITIRGGLSTWSECRRTHLHDAVCLWQDLDGLVVGAAPARQPFASLLHAWTPTRLVRVRIEGDDCLVAEVDRDELAHIPVVSSAPWGQYNRVGQARLDIRLGAPQVDLTSSFQLWEVYDTESSAPITFVSLA